MEGRKGNYRHGATVGGRVSPTYSSWRSMIQRCTNPRVRGYADYGGRGIKVCKRWGKFSAFLADMGEKPPGTSIERRKNHRGYSPGNCFWADAKQQARNRRDRKTYATRGRAQTIAAWAEEVGLPFQVVQVRLTTLGWDIEKALTTPVQAAPTYAAFGISKTLTEWAAEYRIDRRLVEKRLRLGWTLEASLTTPRLEQPKLTDEERAVRRHARNAVAQALRSGRMQRPERCQHAGCRVTVVQAHHHKGYAREAWLDIKWLCRTHHAAAK